MANTGYIFDDHALNRLRDMQTRLRAVEARRQRYRRPHKNWGDGTDDVGTLMDQVHKMVTDNSDGWDWVTAHATL